MAKFVDLYLSPRREDEREADRLIREAAHLGYKSVALATSKTDRFPVSPSFLKASQIHGVEAVKRLNLTPSIPRELLQDLRAYRRNFEVVSVTCEASSLARLAAKDSRVDILRFPLSPGLRLFGEAEAELASNSNVAMEVDMASVLAAEEYAHLGVFRELRRRLVTAEKFKVPVVASSGARDVYGLRAPKDIAAFLKVLGFSSQSSLKAVSETPAAIVERNREKLSSSYVGVGVRLVEEVEGKDE